MNDYRLRNIEREDLPVIWKWRNAEHIRIHMYNDQPIPWEDHVAWFDREQQNTSSYTKLFIHKNRPLGLVRFSEIDLDHQTCHWGFYIGEKNAPKGSGTVMGMLALHFLFSEVEVRKVCAEVLGFNAGSLRYHEKLGFVQEGRLKEQIKRGDQLIDVIPMGLFKDVWEKKHGQLRCQMGGMEGGNQNW